MRGSPQAAVATEGEAVGGGRGIMGGGTLMILGGVGAMERIEEKVEGGHGYIL